MSGSGPQEPFVPGNGDSEDAHPEFSIARSKALIPLLVVFGAMVLLIFWMIAGTKPVVRPIGAVADAAFGPADFPAVFGEQEVLVAHGDERSPAPELAFPVPAPPFTEGIFPCSECHAFLSPNPERRLLEGMHSDIEFRHDAENRWCLDCHDVNDRDQLRLANGTLIPFTESHRLCGQCHGTIYRDWREGIHGKRTGYWDGSKRYLLCVHCHNPHSPRFAPLRPLPPPIRPQFLGGKVDGVLRATPDLPHINKEHENARAAD
jgi:hypothetical protein